VAHKGDSHPNGAALRIASALSSRLTKPASGRHLGADIIGTLPALRRKISGRVFGGAASL
jgi:hypothetical protein